MQREIKIVWSAYDKGGAQAILPVLKYLSNRKNINLHGLAGGAASQLARSENLNITELEHSVTKSRLSDILTVLNPSLLLTASSGTNGTSIEQACRNFAFENKISSVVIVDYWTELAARWIGSSYSIKKLPDKVCIMDWESKEDLLKAGFPEDKIFVTGQPYFEQLFTGNIECLQEHCIDNILFLSQPVEIIPSAKNITIHPLEELLICLSRYYDACKISLAVRPHPRGENLDHIKKIIDKYRKDFYSLTLLQATDSLFDLMKKYNCIISNFSSALLEARSLGKNAYYLKTIPIPSALKKVFQSLGIPEFDYSGKMEFPPPMLITGSDFHRGALKNVTEIIKNTLNMAGENI